MPETKTRKLLLYQPYMVELRRPASGFFTVKPSNIGQLLVQCAFEYGVIDFNIGEVQLFEENILGSTFGDCYISCDCKDTDDEDMRNVDLLISYCLERY